MTDFNSTDQLSETPNPDGFRVLKRGTVDLSIDSAGGTASVDITDLNQIVLNPIVMAWAVNYADYGGAFAALQALPTSLRNAAGTTYTYINFDMRLGAMSSGINIVFSGRADASAAFKIYYVVLTASIDKDTDIFG